MNKNFSNNLTAKIFIFLMIILLSGIFIFPVNATTALKITNLEIINITDRSVTISWTTNQSARGSIEYSANSGQYSVARHVNTNSTEHTLTVLGLNPDTNYYFRVRAINNSSEALSFEQGFKTKTLVNSDYQTPVISDLKVIYITGQTATIQWTTNELATTEIEYGRTENYNHKKYSYRKTWAHDVTLTNLVEGATYHYLIKSKDDSNNTAVYIDRTFRTKITNELDRNALTIYNIKPASENDALVTKNSAVIRWRTNKPSEGWVRFGTNQKYNKKIATNPPRAFFQSVMLTNLKPHTTYYFEIEAKDILGKKIKSNSYSFTTKGQINANLNGIPLTEEIPLSASQITGRVLGVSESANYGNQTIEFNQNCNLDADIHGFYGIYYNLTTNHPDVELYRGKDIPNNKIARQNNWYNQEYYAFNRIDSNLKFGKNFFPVNEDKAGDPYHFAVHWRAMVNAPQSRTYNYKIVADDDAWVFIDGRLTTNLGGVHPAKTKNQSIYLSAGLHKIEIYYAERSRNGSAFTFSPDPQLAFYPLRWGCNNGSLVNNNLPVENNYINNSNANQLNTINLPTLTRQTGQVLGASESIYDANYQSYNQRSANDSSSINNDYYFINNRYVCNPTLGYTPIVALYKTDNPEIWAILETGFRHYITSPEAFEKYECNWSKVKKVSQTTLKKYPRVKLVKELDSISPAIYMLSQRPEGQWLKTVLPSKTVFISYNGNYWGNVARVDQLDINVYPNVTLVKIKNSPSIYLLEENTKRLIASPNAFERLGFSWSDVVEISQAHLNTLRNGATIY